MIKLKPLVFSLESSVKRNLLGLELLAIVSQSDFSNPVKEVYHRNSGSHV